MTTFFEELLHYTQHSNLTVFEQLQAQTEHGSEKTELLFNHTLNAHHIWNHRIMQRPAQYTVWQMHPANLQLGILKQNYQDSLHILQHFNLQESIHYSNTKGETYTNTVQDILFHVINHSTYHRAQIASALKQSGSVPPVSDYIAYKRR